MADQGTNANEGNCFLGREKSLCEIPDIEFSRAEKRVVNRERQREPGRQTEGRARGEQGWTEMCCLALQSNTWHPLKLVL